MIKTINKYQNKKHVNGYFSPVFTCAFPTYGHNYPAIEAHVSIFLFIKLLKKVKITISDLKKILCVKRFFLLYCLNSISKS